jgi:hypothetical protein
MEGFDISRFEIEDVATLTVKDVHGTSDLIGADGENPVTIELYSPGSVQGIKALHRAGMATATRLQSMARGKLDKKSAEIADKEAVDKLVGFTHKINNFPIAPEALYSNPKVGYITKQVADFISDEANFSKPSTTSSAST